MEIKKFLEKIYEIYSDFSSLFADYEKIRVKDSPKKELLLKINEIRERMISFFENKNKEKEISYKNEKENDMNISVYIDLFLNLMFDEVKKFKIIRPKKTGSK